MSDLISRQAVKTLVDELARAIRYERYFIPKGRSTETIMQDILDLPSVEPERKTGRWVEHQWAEEENGLLISNWECNLCKMWERKTSDFCPNCGKPMEVQDDKTRKN